MVKLAEVLSMMRNQQGFKVARSVQNTDDDESTRRIDESVEDQMLWEPPDSNATQIADRIRLKVSKATSLRRSAERVNRLDNRRLP